jgi:succinylglutamic semialdehyde dehydrogenase
VAQALNEAVALGDYLGGRFVAVPHDHADGSIERVSPRDFNDVTLRARYRHDAVDEAIDRAQRAFPLWAARPLDERTALLRVLRERLSAHAEAFALAITREVGKPLWEARTELSAALNKIDITLSDGLALVAPREVAKGQRYAFKPHGVAAVLGPFNFPLHLVHGHVVPLLALGNTVVIKPSELAPLVGQLYAQCFHEAGFPDGVFNLVQGPASQGALLAAHPRVDVVALTGSVAAGQAIKRATLDQPNKLLALELGGRNPAIVLADADMDKAVHDVLWGALVTSGQRCSGTAVALVERACFATFTAKLKAQMEKVVIGDPLTSGVFMGPLVSEAARARYLAALAEAQADGVRRIDSPRSLSISPEGTYVSPSLHVVDVPKRRAYEHEELFGPDLALQLVEDLDQALVSANDSQFGLSASVFTRNESKFEHAFHALRYGCVNWNAPTCGASSRLPFGGTRQSGNHRPAALFSSLYAAYPVATLQGAQSLDATSVSPGFPLPEQSSG